MISSSELKTIAKTNLKGRWGTAIGAMLLTGIVGSLPLCQPAMTVGYAGFNTKLARGEKPNAMDILNEGFSVFGKSLWLIIITAFFVSLWSMLLLIPGIVKSYAYQMGPYILAENPTMTAREALSASKTMMAGKKGKLFWLELSFFFWILLTVITFGAAAFYVIPYISAATGAFYNEAKK
jgi:uncharacterized membrane protein